VSERAEFFWEICLVYTSCVAIIGSKSKAKQAGTQAGSSRFAAVHLDKAPYDT